MLSGVFFETWLSWILLCERVQQMRCSSGVALKTLNEGLRQVEGQREALEHVEA